MIEQQNQTITYMKAIGIILMVMAHCSPFMFFYQIVYSFHMPLFFIVSGYLFKEKYFRHPISFLWKRVKGLWWPFVKWSLLFLLFHDFFYKLNIYNGQYGFKTIVQHLYTKEDFIERAFNIFLMTRSEPLLGGYWFLNALFWGSLIAFTTILICHFISKKFKISYYLMCTLGGVLLLCLCIYVNYIHKTFTIFLIGPQALLAATFFITGHYFAIGNIRKFSWKFIVIAFGLMVANSSYNLIEIGNLFYETPKIIPYIFTAVLGTWCIYSLPWHKLKGKMATFVDYIGNHTLFILTWHFLCFKFVSLTIIAVYGLPFERLAELPVIGEFNNLGWFFAYSFAGVGLPLLVVYLYETVRFKTYKAFHSY